MEEIYRQKSTCSYKFLGKNVIASGFYLVSSKMKRFTKIVNRWILLSIFTRSSILDVWLSFESVPDYYWDFFCYYQLGCYSESFNNYSNVIRILYKTCQNRPMRDQKGFDKVVLVSFLLTWNKFTRGKGVSTSENPALKDT